MIITPVKTDKVLPRSHKIFELLDNHLPEVPEKTVVAITSKIVSLCEGRVLPMEDADKEKLVREEAEYFLPSSLSKYDYPFTITKNTLIPASGIDESNGSGHYILWPIDPQETANEIRAYLKERFQLKEVGVIITDSTCMPLRWGTIGIALSHSGFKPLNSYVGKPDLFGRPFKVSRAGVASGLAAAAVVAMGEGSEQTPIAVIQDVPFIKFQDHDPTKKDIAQLLVAKDKDLYGPFFEAVNWEQGKNGKKNT